jgi:thioredoxin reductase (NADPH)
MGKYDVVIIGAGPAGLTAGIFAARRGLKAVVLGYTGSMPQAEEATAIDNWPGDISISGADLVKRFEEHAKGLGVEMRNEKVVGISKKAGSGKADKAAKRGKAGKGGKGIKGFVVKSEKSEYESKTIIIATGTKHRKGMIKGEAEFAGRGVSYCAACDAPLFRGRRVLYVGGGDSAVMGALLSSRVGSKTMLIHRRDRLRAVKSLQEQILKSDVKIIWNTVPVEIKGDKFVKSVVVMNNKTKKEQEIPVDAVFVAMGTVPTAELAKDVGIKVDKGGFIIVDKEMKTSMPGIFAAGDCTSQPLKQIITAAADGAIAATSAYFYFHDY